MTSNLAILLLFFACFVPTTYSMAAEKHDYEVTRETNGAAGAVIKSACQHDTEHATSRVVNGTATCARPRSFIEHDLTTALCVYDISVRRDVTSRRQGFNRPEREPSESHGRTVRRTEVAESQGINLRGNFNYRVADRHIESVVDSAISELKPLRIEVDGLSFPSIQGYIDGHHAGNWPFWVNSFEVIDHMGSGKEVLLINKKPSTVDQLNRELASLIDLSAQNRHDRTLYSLYAQNESVGAATLSKSKKVGKKNEKQKKRYESNDSHISGLLSL